LVKEDQLSNFATFAFIFDIQELTPAQKKKKKDSYGKKRKKVLFLHGKITKLTDSESTTVLRQIVPNVLCELLWFLHQLYYHLLEDILIFSFAWFWMIMFLSRRCCWVVGRRGLYGRIHDPQVQSLHHNIQPDAASRSHHGR